MFGGVRAEMGEGLPGRPEEVIPGLDFFERDVGFLAIRLHYSADPEKDAEWARAARLGMPHAGWQREMEIDFEARGGDLVYPMFDRNVHVRAMSVSGDATRYRGMDHGMRSPTTCLWAAVSQPSDPWHTHDVYFYREYTRRGRTIQQNCLGVLL